MASLCLCADIFTCSSSKTSFPLLICRHMRRLQSRLVLLILELNYMRRLSCVTVLASTHSQRTIIHDIVVTSRFVVAILASPFSSRKSWNYLRYRAHAPFCIAIFVSSSSSSNYLPRHFASWSVPRLCLHRRPHHSILQLGAHNSLL